MNETQEQLEKNIKLANYRLQQLRKKELLSEEVNKTFNQLLIKKAVMVKELHSLNDNKIKTFIAKTIRKFKRESLICDKF